MKKYFPAFLILFFSFNALSFSEKSYFEELEKISTDFQNSSQLLSFSQFENEIIEVSKDSEKRIIIYSIGNKTNRRFFDQDYRLKKSEFWEIASYNDSKIIKNEFFYYRGQSKKAYLKSVDYEDKWEDFYYSDNGSVIKSEKYKKVRGKNYITETSRWTYDSQNRVTQLKIRTFFYNSDEDTKRRDVFVKNFFYSYNTPSDDGSEIPPDVKYYENDVLKSYEKYSNKAGNYTQQYFFDGGISIKTWYEDNKKVREVIYQNDKVMRVNNIDEHKNPPEM